MIVGYWSVSGRIVSILSSHGLPSPSNSSPIRLVSVRIKFSLIHRSSNCLHLVSFAQLVYNCLADLGQIEQSQT